MRTFSGFRFLIGAATALLLPTVSFADTFSLSSLTLADYDKIVKEFSSNFTYSSVNGASGLGGLGHFELGVVGGQTKSPELDRLVKAANSGSKFKGKLYHGGAMARIGLPYSLTVESVFFPKTTVSEATFQEFSGAIMWTTTDDVLSMLPLSIAPKFFYTSTKVGFRQNVTQTVSGTSTVVNAGVDFNNTLWGLQLLASKKLLMFEPYVGFGYVKAKGDLKVNASGTVNTFSFPTQNNEASSSPKSALFLLGADVQLLFLSLGAEYQRSFGASSMNGRLSFRF